MVNKPKKKGTEAETAVVNWAKKHEFYAADRLALHGRDDVGDVLVAHGVMVQVKDGYTERREPTDYQIDTWLKETEKQRKNGNHTVALLVHKRFGKSSPDEWRWYVDKYNAMILLGSYPGLDHAHWPQYIQLQGYTIPALLRKFLRPPGNSESEAA
jgi:hypothetical protein